MSGRGRSGFLSSMMLLKHLVGAAGPDPSERVAIALGRLTARLHAMRRMSLSVATQLAARRQSGAGGGAGEGSSARCSSRKFRRSAHDLFGLGAVG